MLNEQELTADPGPEPDALVGQLTESQMLAQIFPLLPSSGHTVVGPGDDAAVVRTPDGRVVVSTDVLVEGQHFRRDWSTGFDVGWRAAVQNLADIAAMGARPTTMVVALVLPHELEFSWLRDFARGMAAACSPWGVGVVGGDLSAGKQIVAAVTVHGDLAGMDPVLRSGAQVGDVVAHAGVRGRSAAGYALLAAGQGAHDPGLVEAFLRPTSPLAAGPGAGAAGATAMLDVSDGLVKDAGRIAAASGVSILLDDPQQVFVAEVSRLAAAGELTGQSVRDWVLTGGEDHGLLATFPPSGVLPDGFQAIGRVVPRGTDDGESAEPAQLVEVIGGAPGGLTGWDHFGSRT